MEFPYGEILPELPQGFMPPEMWPESVAVALPRSICAREEVGPPEGPRGIRWSLWPLTFEEYVGDVEPDISAAGGSITRNRFVAWKRVRRSDTPDGWYLLSRQPWRVDGYILLSPNVEVSTGWHKQARRDLRRWKENYEDRTHVIEKISMEDYSRAYARSTVRRAIGLDALHVLRRKRDTKIGIENSVLWGVRNIQTKEIIAGLAARHSPTFESATYECPFILEEAKQTYGMTGLMNHWLREAVSRHAKIAVLNSFWQPGEPKSWKSFSLFKSHFGPSYVAYPPTLWKFVPGKLF